MFVDILVPDFHQTFILSIVTLFLKEDVILDNLRMYLNIVNFSCGLLMVPWLIKDIFN